jgi:hypothetical protein
MILVDAQESDKSNKFCSLAVVEEHGPNHLTAQQG